MKTKQNIFFGFAVLIIAAMFVSTLLTMAGCDNGGSGGDSFVSQTVAVANDKATLGFVGVTTLSNKTNIATATIESGEVKITSVAEGSATITVSDSTANAAGVSISVSKTGIINIVYISKYNGDGSGVQTQTGQTYNLLFGNFGYATDAEILAAITANGWTASIVNATDGKYLKGTDANSARTFFLQHSGFHLQGGADGTWDYLTNTFTYKGVGLPNGDLKTKMTTDKTNCPLAGMFRDPNGALIVFYVSENKD